MPDSYDVRLTAAARKQLGKLERSVQRRIVAALRLLATTPRPPAARALSGRPGYLRIRVGDYRVIYTIDDGELVVLVVTMGHRRDVYR